MSVNKIVVKVDGSETKTLDFNDIATGLTPGSHTIDVEAYDGVTLKSSDSKTINIISSYEPETDAYVSRVEADGGVVQDVAYVDAVYSKMKELGILNNCNLWISPKAGVKKDASNYVSKVYSLDSSNRDYIQNTGSKQPLLSANKLVFDGADDTMTPVSNIPFGSNFTIENQIDVTFKDNGDIFAKEFAITFISYSTKKIKFYIGDGASWGNFIEATGLNNSTLYNVVGTHNGSNTELIINNVSKGTVANTKVVPATNTFIASRAESTGSSHFVNGNYYSTRVWDIVLTQSQRDQLNAL
jgi:hypothetical protein